MSFYRWKHSSVNIMQIDLHLRVCVPSNKPERVGARSDWKAQILGSDFGNGLPAIRTGNENPIISVRWSTGSLTHTVTVKSSPVINWKGAPMKGNVFAGPAFEICGKNHTYKCSSFGWLLLIPLEINWPLEKDNKKLGVLNYKLNWKARGLLWEYVKTHTPSHSGRRQKAQDKA